MKHRPTTLLLLSALVAGSIHTQAQQVSDQGEINAATTDSITYTQQGDVFQEHAWRKGEIVHTRTVGAGTPISFFWQEEEMTYPCTVFARGVSKEKGWYDVNKKKDGRTGKDAVLCWAAACANMLEWWQDRYRERFGELPAKAITGPGKEYELALFELYQRDWNNINGSEVDYGIPWYLTGEDRTENVQGVDQPKAPGGYYAEEWDKIAPLMEKDYVYSILGYSTWGDGWDVDPNSNPLQIVTDIVVDALRHGLASFTVRVGYSNMHAITLWGYDLNEKGQLSRVYVTDSDDMLNRPNEPRVQILNEYDIEMRNGREVGLVNMIDKFNMIARIIPFKGNLN